MTPEIRLFDAKSASRAEWAALHVYRKVRGAEEFPDVPLLDDAEFEAEVQRLLPLVVHHRFLAWHAGEIVGNIILGVRRPDTPHYEEYEPFVDVFGGVLKQQRRRGVGRALFAQLHDFMQANGKTLASTKVLVPDGHGFLMGTGAEVKFRSVESRLAMSDVPWSLMPGWILRTAGADLALQLEVHAPRVPIPRLAQLVAPLTALINQQPLGQLEMAPIRYELGAFESWYGELDRRGGEHYMVVLSARAMRSLPSVTRTGMRACLNASTSPSPRLTRGGVARDWRRR